MENDPTSPAAVTAPPRTATAARSRRWLWITLAVVAALVLAGGGGAVFAVVQYGQPGAAAGTFCGSLKTQNYAAAYKQLSAKLKTAYTPQQFTQANVAIDGAEGKVSACGLASGNGSYDYRLGSGAAAVAASVTRAKQGSLRGALHLVNQSGKWLVDGLDTSLLGINLGALQTLGTFCAALETQNYPAAYAVLSGSLQSAAPEAAFSQLEQLQDRVDGKVTGCAISAVGAGNSDTATMVTATLTRSALGARSGTITLGGSAGKWKITTFDTALQGTNLGPLIAGNAFVLLLDANDFAGAYKLFSRELQAQHTEEQFTQDFDLPTGYKYLAATPDLSTYKTSAGSASYSGTIGYSDPSNATHVAYFTIEFAFEGGAWLINGVQIDFT